MTTAAGPKTTPEGSTSPSPAPQSPPQQRVTAPGPRVKEQPQPSPIPSPATGSPADASVTGESADARSLPPDPLAATGTPSASEDYGPGPEGSPLKLKKRPIGEVIRGLVIGASAALHQQLARHELEQQQGVWLMSEDEAAGVADPLANIATRHAGGSVVNPDTGDLIAAGLAAAGYLISNAVKAFQLRRAIRSMQRAGMETPPAQPHEGATQ